MSEEPTRRSVWWLGWVALLAGGAAGLLFGLLLPAEVLFVPRVVAPAAADEAGGEGAAEFWACPMFCTRMDGPGNCPVCGMELSQFVDTGDRLPLDARQRASVGLHTEPIERRLLAREIRTLGDFQADETREKVVAAWVDGRIEKLYADFTGVEVEEGWHLFDLYSPSLYAGQKELIVAHRASEKPGLSQTGLNEARRLVTVAREKLRLLGLNAEQVAYIEELEEPDLTLTIPSPAGGIVTQKMAHVGMYVKQGQPVFRIADLDRLWLMVEVHERDVGFVALGQQVDIRTAAFPGEVFNGVVGFIDPVLAPSTRTVSVRVEVPNPDGRLKPGMYGTATILARLDRNARVATPRLEGDFACPMHPLERGREATDRCDECGMPMAPSPHRHGREPARLWAVPRDAVLTTGTRQLVYVEWWVQDVQEHTPHQADQPPPVIPLEEPEYQGFPVELGPLAAEYHLMEDGSRHRLGEYYPLLGGLPTGIRMPGGDVAWRVVTRGQFLIDSQLELTGKPSLLRPGGGAAAPDPHAGH